MPHKDPEARRAYQAAYQKAWRERNPEKARAYVKRWTEKNPDAWRRRDPESVKAAQQRYNERHPERLKEARARWYAKNPKYSLEWQRANPEKAKAYRAKTNAKPETKAYQAQWARDNPEKVKAAQARYYAADPERRKEISRRHKAKGGDAFLAKDAANKQRKREADREAYNAAMRAWRAKNPEKVVNYLAERNRRLNGTISDGIIGLLLSEQANQCPYCLRFFSADLPPTIDHYYPVRLGGKHHDDNLQLACKPCNSRKHRKDPAKFLTGVSRMPGMRIRYG